MPPLVSIEIFVLHRKKAVPQLVQDSNITGKQLK